MKHAHIISTNAKYNKPKQNIPIVIHQVNKTICIGH